MASFKRLAADHASLHNIGLPPYYLFPPSSSSDTLTQLTVLLTGPHGTPYSQGLWKLHLRIPEDYPKSPPKASFRTRIWHPNVEESTGAVCVDTLKRDWDSKLTLRDILITISCLLIHPNPDSALNSAAGALLQDNYEAFARQAKLLTSIHAPIPSDMAHVVSQAKKRGDDNGSPLAEDEEVQAEQEGRTRKGNSPRLSSNIGTRRRKALGSTAPLNHHASPLKAESSTLIGKLDIRFKSDSFNISQDEQRSNTTHIHHDREDEDEEDLTEEEPGSESESEVEEEVEQENDPSISPSPVTIHPPSPRKSVLGKRPLAVIPTSDAVDMVRVDDYDDDDYPDDNDYDINNDDDDGDGDANAEYTNISTSAKNIANNNNSNHNNKPARAKSGEPLRKSPKLSLSQLGVGGSGRKSSGLNSSRSRPTANNNNINNNNNSSSSSSSSSPKSSRPRNPNAFSNNDQDEQSVGWLELGAEKNTNKTTTTTTTKTRRNPHCSSPLPKDDLLVSKQRQKQRQTTSTSPSDISALPTIVTTNTNTSSKQSSKRAATLPLAPSSKNSLNPTQIPAQSALSIRKASAGFGGVKGKPRTGIRRL